MRVCVVCVLLHSLLLNVNGSSPRQTGVKRVQPNPFFFLNRVSQVPVSVVTPRVPRLTPSQGLDFRWFSGVPGRRETVE